MLKMVSKVDAVNPNHVIRVKAQNDNETVIYMVSNGFGVGASGNSYDSGKTKIHKIVVNLPINEVIGIINDA